MNSTPSTADNAVPERPIPSAIPVAEQQSEKAEQPEKDEQPRKGIPMASIPVTILIGLLIAALYLGGRILTAHRIHKPAPAIQSVTPAPPPVPAPAEAKAVPSLAPAPAKLVASPAPSPAPSALPPAASFPDDGLPTLEPHPGERYLQVGALDPDANDTRRFVERLRNEGLDPHVAEGPTPALMRVLIGPFTKIDELNEKKAQIESEGIDTFVREY